MIVPAVATRPHPKPAPFHPEPDDACLRWLHGLAVKSCAWWEATSGDTSRLVWTSSITTHLVRWAVGADLIEDPGFVHHTKAEDALFPVYLNHKDAATDEARRHVMQLAEKRGAVLTAERVEAERVAREEADRLTAGGDS